MGDLAIPTFPDHAAFKWTDVVRMRLDIADWARRDRSM